MRILPLGIGDAFSSRFYTHCLAVESGGHWILVDCPHPIRKMMREASSAALLELDASDIHAVVLTHLHADHSSGLESLAFFSHFALQRPLALVAHPKVATPLWEQHLKVTMVPDGKAMVGTGGELPSSFDAWFTHTALDLEQSVPVGPFNIRSRRTLHPVFTTALLIEAEGLLLGISSDTSADPELMAWLSEADLIVHEVGFGLHTPLAFLQEQPEPIRRKLHLTHLSDAMDLPACPLPILQQGLLSDLETLQDLR